LLLSTLYQIYFAISNLKSCKELSEIWLEHNNITDLENELEQLLTIQPKYDIETRQQLDDFEDYKITYNKSIFIANEIPLNQSLVLYHHQKENL